MARRIMSRMISEEMTRELDFVSPARLFDVQVLEEAVRTVLRCGEVQMMLSIGPVTPQLQREFRVVLDDLSDLPNRFRLISPHSYRMVTDWAAMSGPITDTSHRIVYDFGTGNVSVTSPPKTDLVIPRPKDIIRRRG